MKAYSAVTPFDLDCLPVFDRPDRVGAGDASLYSIARVSGMDMAHQDYSVHLTVSAGDPDKERALADLCVNAINRLPQVLEALRIAEGLLDSVAYVSSEGDTEFPLREIRAALDAFPLALSENARRPRPRMGG